MHIHNLMIGISRDLCCCLSGCHFMGISTAEVKFTSGRGLLCTHVYKHACKCDMSVIALHNVVKHAWDMTGRYITAYTHI